MMHQKTDHDHQSSSSKQDSSTRKRPRSFYSSNIKSWASRLSGKGGNPSGTETQNGVAKHDVSVDLLKQGGEDGRCGVKGFSVIVDSKTVAEESPRCAKKLASIGTKGVADCDVVISDSDDDLVDFQRVQDPKKDINANPDPPSDTGQNLSKVCRQKALSSCAKTTSKTASDNVQSSSSMVLEIDSDDGESSQDETPFSKSLNSHVDFGSNQPSANRSSTVHSPVIEIDSDSCSSIGDGVPSQTNAMQKYSVSHSIEKRHLNSTPTLPLSSSNHRNARGTEHISFPNTHVAPVQQYPSFQGAFQNYCGVDKTSNVTFAASHLSNGPASFSTSSGSCASGAPNTDNLSEEHLLALLKNGVLSLQLIAGIPVLCPTNLTAQTPLAQPFDSSGLQPNMKTIGSIFSPSLLTPTLGYGAYRGTLLGPGPVSRAPSANTARNGSQRRILKGSAMSGVQSSFNSGDGRENLPKAKMDSADLNVGTKNKAETAKILNRKRARTRTYSPSKKARDKANTVEPKVDKDKDIVDKTVGDKKRTDKDENDKNKPNKDTAEKAKKDGERPVAKTLMDLAKDLVSKQVIVGLIKVTKRNLEEKPEEESLLKRLQDRHGELKRKAETFQLKTKECICGRFKTESSNVLLDHLQRGCSTRFYRCCFCLSITQSHRTFRQHMARLHKIVVGCQKHDQRKNFTCSFCPFGTNYQPTFDSHSKRCLRLLQTERNLHPSLEDFDIPILFEERNQQQIAKEISLAASMGSKTYQYCNLNPNLGAWCRTCGKYFSSSPALRRHRNSIHKMPDPRSSGTPLKQATPATPKNSGSRTPSSRMLTTVADPQAATNTIKCCLCYEILGREMVQHFRIVHCITLSTMLKKHFCYFCDCSLQNFKGFEEHMLNSHSYIFPDIKTLWKKILAAVKAKERDALIAYDTSGSDDTVAQPWRCLRCQKRFLSASFCYRHVMLFHITAKIECQLCPKMIATGATYTQHLQQCHIRKCQTVIERLCLPSLNTSPPETGAVQLIPELPELFPTCNDKRNKEQSESAVASPKIESPSIASLDPDFSFLDKKDSSFQPATVCF